MTTTTTEDTEVTRFVLADFAEALAVHGLRPADLTAWQVRKLEDAFLAAIDWHDTTFMVVDYVFGVMDA
jgi:hypothetical protein